MYWKFCVCILLLYMVIGLFFKVWIIKFEIIWLLFGFIFGLYVLKIFIIWVDRLNFLLYVIIRVFLYFLVLL